MKWNQKKVIDELSLIRKEIGYFPSKNKLLKMNRKSLAYAISKSGGFLYYRKLMGDNRKPSGYWKELDNVLFEVNFHFEDMIKQNIMPSYSMMWEIAKIPSSICVDFGMDKIAKSLNCRILSKWKCRDGHTVSSYGEYLLDEYLFSMNISHEPEVLISPNHRYKCDQKIDEFFIELWGCKIDDKSGWSVNYNKKRKTKESLYKKLKLNLISIEYSLFLQSPEQIEKSLDVLFSSYGFKTKKKNNFDVSELMSSCETKVDFTWNYDVIFEELKKLIKKNTLPSQKEFLEMGRGDLLAAVNKFGGLYKFSKDLNCKVRKLPNNYWTVDKVLETIDDEVGFFPTPGQLKSIERHDLLRAISRNGGFTKLRKIYDYRQKLLNQR